MRRNLGASAGGDGFLPFLDQALERGIVELGKSYEILEYAETRRRTGHIIKTKHFQVFFYKSQSTKEIMDEVLDELMRLNPSHPVYMELNNTSVEGYELWVEDEESRLWTKSKKHNILDAYQCRQIVDTQKKRNKA
jgi:hypothetical protein